VTKNQRKRLREALVAVKVGRSRASRTGLTKKSAVIFEEFADSVCELYQLLDELDIEAIEEI
jgi:hypothetical protein